MLKATPAAHPDHELLEAALGTVKSLAGYVNEHKQGQDIANELNEIQRSFSVLCQRAG